MMPTVLHSVLGTQEVLGRGSWCVTTALQKAGSAEAVGLRCSSGQLVLLSPVLSLDAGRSRVSVCPVPVQHLDAPLSWPGG